MALLGGPKELWPDDLKKHLQHVQESGKQLLGVDRGSLLLLEEGVVPDIAIGDFDSLKAGELDEVERQVSEIRYSQPVKDWTDSELMLQAAFQDYEDTSLTIYGATGGRLDHFLVNLLTFLKPEFRPYLEKVQLIDQQNVVEYRHAGKHHITPITGYPYIGIVALTPIDRLTIRGARYQLDHFSSKVPIAFASNEFLPRTSGFEVSLDQGVICLIYSRDRHRFMTV